MGAVCCCLGENCEDYVNPNSSIYRNCVCLHCFVQNLLHMYATIFRREERLAIQSSIPGSSSLISTSSTDDAFSEMYHSPPRPLPYDADPRYIRLQRDEMVPKQEKCSSHSNEESEPLRRSDVDADSESFAKGGKWNESSCVKGSKDYNSKSSLQLSSAKVAAGFAHMYSFPEDEDVCPTCLEEYTSENPKIMTKCSHHYHLGCIYEWMERSVSCPVCGKVMEFDETT